MRPASHPDKAGAYAVQGLGGRFVRRISGSYFNVMGLPVARLYEELLAMGIEADALSPNAVKDTYTLWKERPGICSTATLAVSDLGKG